MDEPPPCDDAGTMVAAPATWGYDRHHGPK
jgi:hypothetical protein